jgi:hypothetical protein
MSLKSNRQLKFNGQINFILESKALALGTNITVTFANSYSISDKDFGQTFF